MEGTIAKLGAEMWVELVPFLGMPAAEGVEALAEFGVVLLARSHLLSEQRDRHELVAFLRP